MKKICRICQTERPLSNFRFTNKEKGNRGSYCRSCWKEENTRRKNSLRERVFGHYGWVCACCSEKEVMFLTIDHKNNDGHRDRTQNGKWRISMRAFYGNIIRDGYPDSYQTLCMNCQWGKRINNGVCPHQSDTIIKYK